MDETDDLDAYNDYSEHDMWIDFTYQENTDELPAPFDSEARMTVLHLEITGINE